MTCEGWRYLAGVTDEFSREIIGQAMGRRITQPLEAQAVWPAATTKRAAYERAMPLMPPIFQTGVLRHTMENTRRENRADSG